MTNKEWLDYLAHNAPDELAAWFDAEHVETEERALDGYTESENADSRELILTDLEKRTQEWHDYDGNYMRIYSDVAYAQMKELLDRQAAITERENLASRLDSYELATMIDTTIKERNELEAKLAEMRELLSQAHLDWLDDAGEYEEIIDKLKSDLNTAVCDNNSLRYELECLEENKTKVWCDCDCCKWQEEREKLTAERDELQRHCKNQRRELAELNNVVNVHRIVHEDGQVDVFSVRELCRRNDELTAERDELKAEHERIVQEILVRANDELDNWKANCDGWKEQALANGNACYEARKERDNLAADLLKANNEREAYRSKFGKCLDYADAIHALMDDEGMA